MENTIKEIQVWYDTTIRDSSKREFRIYVKTTDNRDGCYYLTGNRYNAAGSYTGDVTKAEWKQVRSLAIVDGKWTTVYENQIATRINSTRVRCPDCGEYDCHTNCNSNR